MQGSTEENLPSSVKSQNKSAIKRVSEAEFEHQMSKFVEILEIFRKQVEA